METNQMEELYLKIGKKVNEMIPEDWSEIYLYAEVDEYYSSEIYFYYYSKEDQEYVYNLDIKRIFEIDEKEEEKMEDELRDYFTELKNEFIKNNQEAWTNLTMHLKEDGDFKIEYDYTDISEADAYAEHIIWEYKYLGIEPEDKTKRPYKIIENYKKEIVLEKEKNKYNQRESGVDFVKNIGE